LRGKDRRRRCAPAMPRAAESRRAGAHENQLREMFIQEFLEKVILTNIDTIKEGYI
jgi:hypothetical protein